MHACIAYRIALYCIALHSPRRRTHTGRQAGQSGLAALLLRKLSSSRRGSFQEHCRRQRHSLQKRKNSGFRVLHRSDMIGHTLFSRCSNLVLPSFQKLTTNLEQSIWGLEFSRANPTLLGTAATLGSSWLSGPSFSAFFLLARFPSKLPGQTASPGTSWNKQISASPKAAKLGWALRSTSSYL